MNVKEKLVELLGRVQQMGVIYRENQMDERYPTIEQIRNTEVAARLIAYGVTVQEWISVEDELPEIPEGWTESPEPVLYMMKNTKTIYAGHYGEGDVWRDRYFRQYADSRNGVDADDVLCWMYQHDLPQPPKGE